MKILLLKLHLSVVLAGFTGVFGRLITLHQFPLTFFRLFLATLLVWLVLSLRRNLGGISDRIVARLMTVGAVLGMHWLFFYWSIKASNVSVGVVCYSLVGFFSAVMEPLIDRRPLSVRNLGLSLMTLLGVGLIFGVDIQFRTGIMLGCVSSFLASLFTILNRRVSQVSGLHSESMLKWEMTGGLTLMLLIMPWMVNEIGIASFIPSWLDVIWLVLLSSVCTLGLQFLQIQVLKKISAFTVNLTYNLEPVYSILLAFVIFNEGSEISMAFYTGVALIMLSVAIQSWFSYRSSPEAVENSAEAAQ